VSLAIGEGEFFSLLGRAAVGRRRRYDDRRLRGARQGRILLQGRTYDGLLNRRPVHMVFQQYALFPHMSIYDNVAFGLKVKGVPRPEHRGTGARDPAGRELEGLERRSRDSSRAASNSGSRSRELSSTNPRHSSSTSRSARST
jgi:ABC-type proline/glycine betaine transport system ATPase subunit